MFDRRPEQMEYYRAVGAKIREVRMMRGISQQDLADAIGMARTHLCRIETGVAGITLFRVVAIAMHLDVSIGTLARVYLRSNSTLIASCKVQRTV